MSLAVSSQRIRPLVALDHPPQVSPPSLLPPIITCTGAMSPCHYLYAETDPALRGGRGEGIRRDSLRGISFSLPLSIRLGSWRGAVKIHRHIHTHIPFAGPKVGFSDTFVYFRLVSMPVVSTTCTAVGLSCTGPSIARRRIGHHEARHLIPPHHSLVIVFSVLFY
jgi:hypothetical protein